MTKASLLLLFALLLPSHSLWAQSSSSVPGAPDAATSNTQEIQELRAELARISARLDALEHKEPASTAGATTSSQPAAATAPQPSAATAAIAQPATSTSVADGKASSTTQPAQPPSPATTTAAIRESAAQQPPPAAVSNPSILPVNLPGGATLNYTFDGYYEYNFNQPPGRVNQLRAYDVLSNVFSINQAAVIFDLDPDVEHGRRYGLRLDLQFGQATDTLQGNPVNEPRPDVYRNIFQAYGTYVVPVGKGLNLDFGKWSSSLGVEGNYTKDQLNYTRSFYFNYLPFYHEGVRAQYRFNDKFALNYWLVNGANQSEPTNGFKDELFGFNLSPTKAISWTSNYYLGQEHPDSTAGTNCTGPVQPGLCLVPITPAPNGKLHIFDNYVTWQTNPRLTFTVEGDYVIQREWANAAPGESSAPSHVIGGAGYVQYQATPRSSFAARAEYLSDRGGLFTGSTQAIKEATGTYKYTLTNGLDAFFEYRRDWSNTNYFLTHNAGAPANHQGTATLGLVWWYGGKQGSW